MLQEICLTFAIGLTCILSALAISLYSFDTNVGVAKIGLLNSIASSIGVKTTYFKNTFSFL